MKHTRATAASFTPVLSPPTVLGLLAGITAGLAGALPARGADLQFIERPPISDTANGADSVFATDLDCDGDTDVLAASLLDKLAWFENDGASPPSFTMHPISNLQAAFGARSVFATDVDGDGDTDILGAFGGGRVYWYENVGGSPPPFLENEHLISDDVAGAISVFATDVNGDGHTDVLVAQRSGNKLVWFKNNNDGPPLTFTKFVITDTGTGPNSVFAVDVDGDGDTDVLCSFATGKITKLAWYENDGAACPSFAEREIPSPLTNSPWSVFAADVDGDGDTDVLAPSFNDHKIAWYENVPGAPGLPPNFTEHVIAENQGQPSSVFAIDLDCDGDTDILSAAFLDDKIRWYENNGGSPPIFTEHLIADNVDGALSVFAIDVDGDGDIDVLAAAFNGDKITWYENTTENLGCCLPSWDVTIGTPGLAGGNARVRSLLGVSNHASVETGLYVGGGIATVGGIVAARGIARWDGMGWSPLLHNGNSEANGVFTTVPGGSADVSAMAIFEDALYVGGEFTTAGGQTANHIARWDGSLWQPLLHNNDPAINGLEGDVWSLIVFDDGTGPALFVGGRFLGAGVGCPDGLDCLPLPLGRIAKWDGNAWSDVGGGSFGEIAMTMAEYNDGSGKALFVGGNRLSPAGLGGQLSLVKWDGSTWTAVDPFLSIPNSTAEVRSLVTFDDGTGPALYAGGVFTLAGPLDVNYVARWNGTEWSNLASGLDNWVFELGVFDDGTGAGLYAGGFFTGTTDGRVAARRIAKWDGSCWSPLGTGLDAAVWALESFDDGTGDGPDLFVGGQLLNAGGEFAARIAEWDGCPLCGGVTICGDRCCAATETIDNCPQDCDCEIAAGPECFDTRCDTSAIDLRNSPIPAAVFGSEFKSFDGVVWLTGIASRDFATEWIRTALANACTAAKSPIETGDIFLQTCAPIKVRRKTGGFSFWDVTIKKSGQDPPPGTISVNRTHAKGGTFSAEFSFNPQFGLRLQGSSRSTKIDPYVPPEIAGFSPFRLRTVGPVSFVDAVKVGLSAMPCSGDFVPGVREDPKNGDQCCERFLMTGPGIHMELFPPGCADSEFCTTGACCLPDEPEPVDQCDDTIDQKTCEAKGGKWQASWPNCDDEDGDGLANWRETRGPLGKVRSCQTGTDPLNPDTDGDGCSDFEEISTGFDPLDPCDTVCGPPPVGVDCNSNGRLDACDIICGKGNICEGLEGSDDCDEDGIPDECDDGACCTKSVTGVDSCLNIAKPECDALTPPGKFVPCEKCGTVNARTARHNGVLIAHSVRPDVKCPGEESRRGAVTCTPGQPLIDPWVTVESDPENPVVCHDFSLGQDDCGPISGGFFGVNSDIFDGSVCLEGVSLGSAFGDADTLVERSADPFDRCEIIPLPNTADPVEVEITDLLLKSVDPITVTFNGGQDPEEWNVTVSLSPGNQPMGTLTATKEHCNGGTYFTENFGVIPLFTFTKVDPPNTVVTLDAGDLGCDPVLLEIDEFEPAPWVHDVDPNSGIVIDPCSDFHPAAEEGEPTQSCDCNENASRDLCDIEDGVSQDCNGDGIPDDCQLAGNDCNDNGIPDECEFDCNGNGVPDDCDIDPADPDGNGLVSEDCPGGTGNGVPDECEPDCNGNGIADSCDIELGTPDLDGNGIPDECLPTLAGRCCMPDGACLVVLEDVCNVADGIYGGDVSVCCGDSDGDGTDDACRIEPPIRAPAPHDLLKNRYISIDPRGASQCNPSSLHIRATLVSSLVNGQAGNGPWWAAQPDAACISLVTTTKPAVEPDWTGCNTAHLTGCPIIPTTTYALAAESRGTLSVDALFDTQAKPGVKWHGDCVGAFSGTEWGGPNGVVNIDDAVAAIKTFQNPSKLPGCPAPPCNATHTSVTDVAPNLVPAAPNKIVNIEDVLIIILGFGGQEYPGPDLTQCP